MKDVARTQRKKEVRKKLFSLISDDKTKKLFYTTTALIIASKGLAIASPWFLKSVVDCMALGNQLNLTTAFYGIGAFGFTRLASTLLAEVRMWDVSKII